MNPILFFLAHLVGDYVLQSDWMAGFKRAAWRPTVTHAAAYAVPFLALTTSPLALLVIAMTHGVIDHFGLARYVVWAKNWLAPRRVPVLGEPIQTHHAGISGLQRGDCYFGARDEKLNEYRVIEVIADKTYRVEMVEPPNVPWSQCMRNGYRATRERYMTDWLTIIVDNTMHLICNYLALQYL